MILVPPPRRIILNGNVMVMSASLKLSLRPELLSAAL
jgi:hypothetical protein